MVGVVRIHGSGWCSACLDLYLFIYVAFALISMVNL